MAAPAAVSDFDAFAAAHAGGVDGLWANNIREVSLVVGAQTYRLSARTFQTADKLQGRNVRRRLCHGECWRLVDE